MNQDTMSKKTVKVFAYIKSYIDKYGWAPTVTEIKSGVDVPPNTIESHLGQLVKEDIIKRGTQPRQIAINPKEQWKK